MKRYIYASIDIDLSVFDGTPFEPDTDTSYYNNFLNANDLAYMQKAKNRNGEIIMMTPNEYFEACANKIFSGKYSVADLKRQREYSRFKDGKSFIDKYVEDMKAGDKFPLCFLNYADHSQEGLHRMYAAGQAFGWNTKFPVLVVTVNDQDWEDFVDLRREASSFEDNDFKDICEEAANNISNWREPPPENLEQIYKEAIIAVAKNLGYDIDAEIETREVDEHQKLFAWISRYKDYQYEVLSNPYEVWVDDLYDMGQYEMYSKHASDESISDDDIDIDDLLFK